MAMDDETKSVIDSLLTGTRRKSRATKEPFSFEKAAETFVRERAKAAEPYDKHWETKYKTEREAEVTIPKTKYCYNINEATVNLKDESATLAVDTASAAIILKAVMNNTVLDRINNSIPVTQKDWDDKARVWRFSPAALPMLKPILKELYKDVIMLGVPKALPNTKFDQLMAKLDKDDKAQVYRLLASKYHPDKGGSHEVMTLINLVFRGS